ncbi:ABC transporter permease [Actinoplanes sp. NPDC051859]|uniref:ABC transporter permease n=1 Tax=Actinoplanes sp. NPDC051859 TaxID=3363909 RepID=UPI0037A4B930
MTGAGLLLRFLLRRERYRLPWWLLGATLLVLIQSVQSQNLYDTPEDLQRLRATIGGNAAVLAMSGPRELLTSIGGEIVFEIFGFAAIVVALMNMFLIGRHSRADEESGRAELIRSGCTGRHAPLAAALALAVLADITVGVLVFAVAAGTGLPAGGSVLFGAALAGVGLTFAALTAAFAQVFENTRTVYGTTAALLGAAFMLRAAGDVGAGTLSWASSIGWGQRTFPYAADRWWPLLLPLAASGMLGGLAVLVANRRDFGAGLIRARLGRADGSRAFRNAYALAWRLQRGTLIGWAGGLFLLGVAYGSIGDTMEQYVRDNPEIARLLPGGGTAIVDSYLALTTGFSVLLGAAYGVVVVLRARAEETEGRAEPVLATATSRATWLGGHLSVAAAGTALVLLAYGVGAGVSYALTVGDAGQVPRLIGIAVAYLPAVWAIVAATTLLAGWAPRYAGALMWTVVGYCVVITLFADSFDLPGWTRTLSPFAHTPKVPLDDLTPTPLLVTTVFAAAVTAVGLSGIRRRDIGY